MAFWNRKKDKTAEPAAPQVELPKTAPEERFKKTQDALTAAWDEHDDFAGKINLLDGLKGDHFTASVSTGWMRDIDVQGEEKPPVLIRTVALDATTNGETVKTGLTVAFRKNADGDHEYKLSGGHLPAPVTTTGRGKAVNTLDSWRAAVESAYGLSDMTARMAKKQTAFVSTAAPPVIATAKP
jgi:hypothetical protein